MGRGVGGGGWGAATHRRVICLGFVGMFRSFGMFRFFEYLEYFGNVINFLGMLKLQTDLLDLKA